MTDTRPLGTSLPGRKDKRTDIVPSVLWIIKTLRDAKHPTATNVVADEAQVSKATAWVWCCRAEVLGLVKRTQKKCKGGTTDLWSWIP